jgi:REP element-mobilizing transposase RayT
MRRLPRFDYRGRRSYAFVLTTFERQPYFCDREVASVLEQIVQSAAIEGFAIPAHCFMPDHLHLVVRGTDEASHLPSFVKRAKQPPLVSFAVRIAQRFGRPDISSEFSMRKPRFKRRCDT